MEPALPGEELIEAGLRDLREQRETVEALLVAIGAPPFAGWESNYPIRSPEILNIVYTNCWLKTTRIRRTRVTMLSFADWSVTNEQQNA
jgi:hypothetical protein